MPPPPSGPRHPISTVIAEQAALWLARRDRGLTADEQDAYLQWLAADPRHAAAMSQHAAALERLMALYDWQPGQSPEPNPDLFAPPRRRALGRPLVLAAAALAICATAWWHHAPTSPPSHAPAASAYLRVNERHALPDGSVVELKDGARLATDFSPAQRRVRLTGEGHFTVARDESRPFIVEAAGVTVRALGTAFNVRIDPHAVEVLVTHGSVRVMRPSPPVAPVRAATGNEESAAPVVSARQRAVVTLAAHASPEVNDVTGPEIADTLAWQAPRFQFLETPLAVAAAEFNRLNRTQITFGEDALRSLRIGGTFRVDNVEGFVRLLEATLDLRATPRGPHEFVLTRAR